MLYNFTPIATQVFCLFLLRHCRKFLHRDASDDVTQAFGPIFLRRCTKL